jgi:hypothetical protein
MSVDAPVGWQVIRSPLSDGPPGGSVCLHPPGDTKFIFGCAGIALDYGAHLPGGPMSDYAPDRLDGWYPATDVTQCPTGPAKVNGQINAVETKPPLGKGLRPVGAHHADWNRWNVSCSSGYVFHPQAWFLPKSKVVIFDYTGHAETAAVLASAKFASDGDAVEPMPAYLSAHLVSVSASHLVVQPFHTYTTGPAGKAYAAAHGLEYPFPNDYYDADLGAKRTIVLNAGTACVGNAGESLTGYAPTVKCTNYAVGRPLAIWVLPDGTTAQSVTEIFRP